MSNTELSTNQPTAIIDDLACSLTKNVVISSSDQENSSSTCVRSNSYDKAMSDVDTEVKKSTPETDLEPSKDNDFHLIKWIEFNYEHLPILLQNVNGPCPLLAIFNILLLTKRENKRFNKKKNERFFSI
jgi:hypothetical protein